MLDVQRKLHRRPKKTNLLIVTGYTETTSDSEQPLSGAPLHMAGELELDDP